MFPAVRAAGELSGPVKKQWEDKLVSTPRIESKTAIVTGAARGLGRAMAIGLLRAGANVGLVDIDGDELDNVAGEAAELAGEDRVLSVVTDVSDEAAVQRAVRATLGKFADLAILINDAGIGPPANGRSLFNDPEKFWETDPAVWRKTIEVNTVGSYLMASTSAPHMIEAGWGRIINVTTSLNAMYMAGCGAYGPSKAALEANTSIMAQDLEGTGVTANVLVPGGPANTRMIPADAGLERAALIQPDVMVPPALWLASNASDGINGMRFQAVLWDPALPPAEAVERAGAPAAWPQLGVQAVIPNGH